MECSETLASRKVCLVGTLCTHYVLCLHQYTIIFTEQPLPLVDLSYYVLPPHQLEPLARDRHVHERASTPDERKLSLVKVIAISLGVPDYQRDLVNKSKFLCTF